jgi:AcrR family transcriptional regulator
MLQSRQKSRALLSNLATALLVWQDDAVSVPAVGRTARVRAREEITREILRIGKAHLVRDGGAALSLRAVAREMGMASSAVYRYVPNRDALLTLLIVDAYNDLGAAVERAEKKVPRQQLLDRFLAVCHGVRNWAVSHPHEYALIYGTPVPGYFAPPDTIPPASRVPSLLVSLLEDGLAAHQRAYFSPLNLAINDSVQPIQSTIGLSIPSFFLLQGLLAWASIYGAVSLELFGHFQNVIAATPKMRRAHFDYQMRSIGSGMGFE